MHNISSMIYPSLPAFNPQHAWSTGYTVPRRTTGLIETEQRYDFNLRWSNQASVGAGKAIMRDESFSEVKTIINYSTGFRHLITLVFGVRTGYDAAWGPDSLDSIWSLGTIGTGEKQGARRQE